MLSQTLLPVLATLGAVCATAVHPAQYHYKRGNVAEGDSRGPCPALNTLANHGILPRDGKNITAEMFTKSIEDTYNIDTTFAYLLGHFGVPLVSSSPLTQTSYQLSELSKHDAIEHDTSLTREDAITGDNHSLNPKLLQALLDDAQGDSITIESVAKSRVRREKESLARGSPQLGTKQTSIAYGEAGLLLIAMGKQTADGAWSASKKDLQTWFGEEKLPQGYQKPATSITMTVNLEVSAKLSAAVAAINKAGKPLRRMAFWG